ncbi:MAG: glutathione S-transferase family protein [Gammaproteobacteria bacterium]|nr:glutathione S-transferase family protein [Gammaproteobacteria bacterium]
MSELTLIIGNKNYSSWSFRAWLYLAANDIEFREIRVPLDEPNTAAELARYSPSRKVPALVDGESTVWESLAICEYVAERQQLAGWPENPPAGIFARSAAHEMHSSFLALRNEFPMNCRARRTGITASPQAEQDIARVIELWEEGRSRFGNDGPWLAGPFSIVDAMYAPVVMRFRTYGMELPAASAAYVKTVIDLPAVQRWLDAAATETEVIAHEDIGIPVEETS